MESVVYRYNAAVALLEKLVGNWCPADATVTGFSCPHQGECLTGRPECWDALLGGNVPEGPLDIVGQVEEAS